MKYFENCVLPCPPVSPCSPMSHRVLPCPPVSSRVLPCPPVSPRVLPCPPVSVRVIPCPSVSPHVLPCPHVSPRVLPWLTLICCMFSSCKLTNELDENSDNCVTLFASWKGLQKSQRVGTAPHFLPNLAHAHLCVRSASVGVLSVAIMSSIAYVATRCSGFHVYTHW